MTSNVIIRDNFDFFLAIIELVWEPAINIMQNKFEQDTLKTFIIAYTRWN